MIPFLANQVKEENWNLEVSKKALFLIHHPQKPAYNPNRKVSKRHKH